MGGIYFASDGNYGPADRLVVVDTTWWGDEDWEDIRKVSDDQRVAVAWAIAREKRRVNA
jgi:hypothetical protein